MEVKSQRKDNFAKMVLTPLQVKLIRAYGGCLGAESRRRAW
jgi:hypothetical protein